MVVRGGVSSGTSRRTRNCCTGCRGASWVDDNQVAGCGRVNRTLDRTRGGNVRRGFAANGDRNGINGLAAVSCRNHQFAAPGCGLTPLLHGARRHVSAHVDDNLCVTPAHNALVSTTDGDLTLSGPKPVMAGDGLQVIGGGVRRGAGVRWILNRLITQSCDGQLVALRAYPRPNAIAI